ncbi:hypothetical protein HRG_006407 [Hirsutella rhossiliensis]
MLHILSTPRSRDAVSCHVGYRFVLPVSLIALVCQCLELERDEDSALELLELVDPDPSAGAAEPLTPNGRWPWLGDGAGARDPAGEVDFDDRGDGSSESPTPRAVGSTGASTVAAPRSAPALAVCIPDDDDEPLREPPCRFLGQGQQPMVEEGEGDVGC